MGKASERRPDGPPSLGAQSYEAHEELVQLGRGTSQDCRIALQLTLYMFACAIGAPTLIASTHNPPHDQQD